MIRTLRKSSENSFGDVIHRTEQGRQRARSESAIEELVPSILWRSYAAGGRSLRASALRGAGTDAADNFYIADAGNNRIRRLNVAVSVDVDPDTLNISRSKGKWITAYIHLPAGRDAAQVNVDSVRLQAIDPADGSVRRSLSNQVLQISRAPNSPMERIDTNQFMLKFDRATVASWASGVPELVLRVQGQFANGRYFSGDTEVRYVHAPSPSPGSTPAFDAPGRMD